MVYGFHQENTEYFTVKTPNHNVQKFISIVPDDSPSDPIGQNENYDINYDFLSK